MLLVSEFLVIIRYVILHTTTIRKRRSVKGKEKTVLEIEKVEEEGIEKKGKENAEQSAWNLEEEGFDDI